jgi:general stress protein YciG
MTTKAHRGFAAMDPEQQRALARLGGQTSHAKGKAHEFTREEASQAGMKGGSTTSQDRAHMARIGSKGGKASRRKKAEEGKGRK